MEAAILQLELIYQKSIESTWWYVCAQIFSTFYFHPFLYLCIQCPRDTFVISGDFLVLGEVHAKKCKKSGGLGLGNFLLMMLSFDYSWSCLD